MSVVSASRPTSSDGTASEGVIVFPPFKLFPGQRRLERDGVDIDLGGRALELLLALVERAGEILSKQDLMARVWPDVTVEEGSLRFHMVALRKALGEDAADRFIVNVPGKGYGFVAAVARQTRESFTPPAQAPIERRRTLPPRPQGVIGREQILRTLSERLLARRFVSIVGPGGIGKTTVALCVGYELSTEFDGAVHFVDLAQISDPHLVAGEIAASVGLIEYSGGSTPGLIAFLREKRLLLIVDNCEHVIGEAAAVIEQLIQEAPSVYVLATSREPLQVEGERVQRLFPLEYPPPDEPLTAVKALEYPAVQYFVERATAATDNFLFDDSSAPLVADICRQLDGIALALELAAGGVEAYGLQGTAALLRGQFTLPLRGKRTAAPRQQTLRATLDWSYTLLSDFERITIRRLALFVGPFTIDAAEAVVVTNEAKADFFVEALAELVSKSLVIAESEGRPAKYRLLATTRTYALERLNDVGEFDAIARRHVNYFRLTLERAEYDAALSPQADWLEKYGGLVGDVRAGLQWSFSPRGDVGVGIGFAGVAVKYLLEMSLMSESHQWSDRAIKSLDGVTQGTHAEMLLQEAYGLATTVFRGNQEEVRVAFERGLEIATHLNDVDHMMRNLAQLTLYYCRIGDFQTALAAAERAHTTSLEDGQPSSLTMAEWMLGIFHNFAGDQMKAVAYCRAVVGQRLESRRINAVRYGVLDRAYAIGALARALWLSGHADEATRIVDDYIEESSLAGHPFVFCSALLDTVSVYVWTGNLVAGKDAIDKLLSRAHQHSLTPYRAIGDGWRAKLEIESGNVQTGIALLRECLSAMSVDRHKVLAVAFSCYLAEALASRGEFELALNCIDGALAEAQIERNSHRLSEILRIRGDILVAMPDRDEEAAEACYQKSLEVAGERSALAWELLATMSLARLWMRQGRVFDARTALETICARFAEGFGTADLVAARVLLDALTHAVGEARNKSRKPDNRGTGQPDINGR